MVRMSVRELEESQEMVCRLNLVESSSQRGMSKSSESTLLAASDDKVDLWSAKTEVYEVIQPKRGNSYRMRCLHYNEGP